MTWRGLPRNAFLVVVCFSVVRADTITTKKDHVSVNGFLTKMANDELIIVAHYASGEKTLTIKAADTEIIEFNGTTLNLGPPPKDLGIGPSLNSDRSVPFSSLQSLSGTIV